MPRELPKLDEMYDFLDTKFAVVDRGEGSLWDMVGERSQSSSVSVEFDDRKCVLCPLEENLIFKCDRFR